MDQALTELNSLSDQGVLNAGKNLMVLCPPSTAVNLSQRSIHLVTVPEAISCSSEHQPRGAFGLLLKSGNPEVPLTPGLDLDPRALEGSGAAGLTRDLSALTN